MSVEMDDRYVEVSLSPTPSILKAMVDEVVASTHVVTTDIPDSFLKILLQMIGDLIADDYLINHNLLQLKHAGATYHTGKYVNGKWVDGIKIEINIKGGDNPKPDEAVVKLYNIYTKVYGKDSVVVVKAGYLSHNGIVFAGLVDSMETTRDGADNVTTLRCKAMSNFLLQKMVGDTWRYYTPYTDIVKDIVTKYSDCPIGYIHSASFYPWKDIIITPDHTIAYWIDSLVKQMNDNLIKDNPAWSLGYYKWYVRQGRFYLLPENLGMPSGLYFTPQTGLMSVDEDRKSDGSATGKYTIKVMFEWRATKGSIIKVQTALYEPEYYYVVSDFKYDSEGDDHYTEFTCKKLSGTTDRQLQSASTAELNLPTEIEPIDDVSSEDMGPEW